MAKVASIGRGGGFFPSFEKFAIIVDGDGGVDPGRAVREWTHMVKKFDGFGKCGIVEF